MQSVGRPLPAAVLTEQSVPHACCLPTYLPKAAMGRRLTARDLPRLADCEALFALAKVSVAHSP